MQAQFRRAILGLAVIALAVAAPVRAQDVDPTGTWDLAFSTQQGPIGAQMIINRQPTGYTGTITSDLGQAQLEAAVKGSAVTVGFTMTMSGGDSLGVTMNGTVTGDDIKGTFDAGAGGGSGEFTGKRAAKAAKDGAAAAPVDVSGSWVVQVTTSTISATPAVTLKQDGEKLTGEYESAQYGKFPLEGTIKAGKVDFGFTMSIEGNSIAVAFTGTADKDGMKGNVNYGDFAEGTFTATRKK